MTIVTFSHNVFAGLAHADIGIQGPVPCLTQCIGAQALAAAALGAVAFVGPVIPAEPKTRVSLRASLKEPEHQAMVLWCHDVP